MNKINNQITIMAQTVFQYGVMSVLGFSISVAQSQNLCSSVFTQNPAQQQNPEQSQHKITRSITQKTQILPQQLSIILEDNIENYQYQKGYITIADMYFNGNLTKTFRLVSTFLGPSQFKRLKWKEFHGTTHEFDYI